MNSRLVVRNCPKIAVPPRIAGYGYRSFFSNGFGALILMRPLIAAVILAIWLYPAAFWADDAIAAAADRSAAKSEERLAGLWRGRSELVEASADGEMVMDLHRTEQGYAGSIVFYKNQGDIVSGVIYDDGTAFAEAKISMEGRKATLTISGTVKDDAWNGIITLADANGKLIDTASFVLTREARSPKGERLPAGFLAHASAKSLMSALAGFDAFAATSARNTPVAANLQPGIVSAMARVAIAQCLPPSAWDSEGEIHAVIAIAQSMAPYHPNPVIILKIPGMAAFRKAMNDNGAKLEGDGETLSGRIPGLSSTWHFADAGGGRMACSPDAATLDFVVKALTSGWSPKHRAGADVAVNVERSILISVRNDYERFMGGLKQGAAGEKSDDALTAAVHRVATKILAAIDGEVPALDNLGIDLSFNKDRLKATFSLSGDTGSGIDNLRVAYAVGEAPKYALANVFPEETVLLTGIADLSKLPEGWQSFYEESLRELADGVMPEKADRLAALVRRFFALGIKDWTTGSYLAGDRLVVATYFRHGDAKGIETFLDEAARLGETFVNNLAGMIGGDQAPSFAIEYEPKAGKIGNVAYQRITLRITPPGGRKKESLDFLFALSSRSFVGVFGQVGESDLKYAVDNHQRPSGGFVDSGSIKKYTAEIADRRIKMLAMLPLAAMADLFVFEAALTGTDPQAMRAEAAELRASQAGLIMAAGATDKALTFECVIPADLVGDFARYADTLKRLTATIKTTTIDSFPKLGDENSAGDDPEEDWEEDWDTSTPEPGKPQLDSGDVSAAGFWEGPFVMTTGTEGIWSVTLRRDGEKYAGELRRKGGPPPEPPPIPITSGKLAGKTFTLEGVLPIQPIPDAKSSFISVSMSGEIAGDVWPGTMTIKTVADRAVLQELSGTFRLERSGGDASPPSETPGNESPRKPGKAGGGISGKGKAADLGK